MTQPGLGRGTDLAWAWVDHLRSGGTTPWSEFADHPASGAHVGGRLLPGAQQLELLRRINIAGRPDPALVDRVLLASAPGRGRSDLKLVGAVAPLAFGPRPVDPGELPAEELLRVAAGLLAEDVHSAHTPPDRTPTRRRLRLRGRSGYRLVGDPWLADRMRATLIARGRPPGERGALVVVTGTDVATMLGHVWSARCLRDGAPAWPDFLADVRGGGGLPRRIDLASIAHRWAEAAGPGRVRVLLDPSRVGAAVGVRRGLAVPPEFPADAGDLARRVAGALGHLVTPVQRAVLLDRVLRPRLQRDAAGPPVVVPPKHRPWVERQAQRLRDRVVTGGYPVEGDPDLLLPRWADGVNHGRATPDRVLDLALGLLLRPVGSSAEGALP